MAISQDLRTAVLLSGPCAYCGDPVPTQVDHIMPRSRGGTDDRANLAPACKGCNMEKLDFTPEEFRAYREEQGLGWPPQSTLDFLKVMIAEHRAKHPDFDLARFARNFAGASGWKDDPGYLLAEACHRFPDADDVAGRDRARLDALLEMRAIRRHYDSLPVKSPFTTA